MYASWRLRAFLAYLPFGATLDLLSLFLWKPDYWRKMKCSWQLENPKWLDDYSAHEVGVTSCGDVIIGEKSLHTKDGRKVLALLCHPIILEINSCVCLRPNLCQESINWCLMSYSSPSWGKMINVRTSDRLDNFLPYMSAVFNAISVRNGRWFVDKWNLVQPEEVSLQFFA